MTPKKDSPPRRGRGRPPGFDRARALGQAMTLFWDRGYEGTSFDDLIAVMGISASSFYNSFTSKEALYIEAVEAYVRKAGRWFTEALEREGTTRDAFGALLTAAASAFTCPDTPAGCMIAVAATQCSPAQSRLRDMMITQRHMAEDLMQARLRRGIAEGDLPETVDVGLMAAYFGAVMTGMGVQARDGASFETLNAIGELALCALSGKNRLAI